jgi:hypothetical protein
MPVDSDLRRRHLADVFCDSCFEFAQGRGWFCFVNGLAVLIACQNNITSFFYELLALKRAVQFFSQRDDRQQALFLRCSPRSWCLRLFGGNFSLEWRFPCSLKGTLAL